MITFQEAKERKTQEQQTVFDAINEYKKTGSETTLNFIIETLRPYTGAVALSMLHSYKKSKSITTDAEEMAWDVSSIVLVKLWKHLKDFRNKYPASIYAWIGITVEHTIIDEVRKTSSELLQFSSDDYDSDDNHMLDKQFLKGQGSPTDVPDNPENIQVTQEMRKVIMGLLDELPTKDAQILRFKYMHHMKNTDIAEEMGVSISTVAHRSKNAEQKLLFIAEAYQKKTGTKLYSIAIFELLGVLYYMSAQETTIPESAYTKFNQMLAEQTSMETTKATGKGIVKRTVKKATDTVTKKIIIGVIVVVIIIGIILGTNTNTPDEPPVIQNTDTQNNDTNSQPQATNKKLEAQLSIITEYFWKHAQREPDSYANAVGRELSHEHYIQLLRDLIITEDILEQSPDIEMSAQELSDFMQHTLNYQGYDATTDWGQYFSKTESGNFLITAGTSIGYKHTWNFPGANLTEKDKSTIHGFGYVNNRSIEVTIYLEKDSLSKLSGYKIQHVDFIFEGAYGYMYLDDFSQSEIENIEYLGQIVWDEHYSENAGRTENLKLYFTLISKMLATDNILSKSVLTSTDNKKYVLVSGQELYDFTLNTFDYETNAGEIEECFSRNADGQYIVYATHLPGITAEKVNGNQFTVTLSDFHLSSILNYCDNYVVFIYSNIDGKGGTMTILASRNENSPLCGYTAFNAHYHDTAIPQDDIQLLKYLDDIYYQ